MDLSIAVTFAALDRLTGPLKKIGAASGKSAGAVAKTTREIAALSKAQAQLGRVKIAQLDLDKSYAAVDTQRRKVRELRLEIAATERPTKRLEGALRAAERTEQRLADTTARQSAKLAELKRAAGTAGLNVDDLAGSERRLAGDLDLANRRLDVQRRKLDAQNQHNARMARASQIGGKLQSAGAQASVAGAIVGAPLVKSASTWRDFQSGMTDIAQKADTTRDRISGIGDEIMKVGPQVGQLPADLAKGLDTLVGLGMNINQATSTLKPIGKTATAYKADIDDLSNTVFAATSNLKLFEGAEKDVGEQQRRTAKALDIMAIAGKRGGFELKDMAKSFPSLTARAQALGQKGAGAVADLAAALQVARRGAGDSDEAATNITNVLAKINMKDTIKNFKQFGVDLPKALKKAYSEGKTPLEAIAELTRDTLKGDLTKLPFLFGDMQAQAGITSLIQNLDDYRKIRMEASLAGDVVDKDFADRMRDSSFAAAQFNATMQVTAIKVGEIIGPVFDFAKAKVAQLAFGFIAWGKAHPVLFQGIVLVAGALASLLALIGPIAIAIGFMMPVLVYMRGGLLQLWKVVRFGGVALRIAGQAFLWLGRLFLANPWMLLIAAIVTVAVLVYENWDLIKGYCSAALAWIGAKMSAAWSAITAAAGALWTTITGAFSGGIGGIAAIIVNFSPFGLFYAAFARVLSWFGVTLPASFTSFGGMLLNGLINGITGKLVAVKSAIVGVANSAKGWFKQALGIKSPSRVFAQFGHFITAGLSQGIGRGADDPVRRIGLVARNVRRAAAASLALPIAAPAFASPPLIAAPAFAAPPVMAANVERAATIAERVAPVAGVGSPVAQGGAGRSAPVSTNHYHNDSYQIVLPAGPGNATDAKSLARQVLEEIERIQRGRAARSYQDD